MDRAMKIIFILLLCIPVILLSYNLLVRLLDEYIEQNRRKKEKKERQAFKRQQAVRQSPGRRGFY